MGIQWVGGPVIMAFGVCIYRHNGHGACRPISPEN